ncbi:type I-B CRISPR-associated protein Cas8b1/Cst1 [Brachyspira innocens]|uniref:type I-B CRISPR-associated protein Cas8b1/Cst1 n=1 Tax=Brachyspira innocens TaxID=13264 RepID=UPI00036F7D29|nr:type I-B CRISPR-associated protein Cas8b1/Cst1 [Brachyspira innocens]
MAKTKKYSQHELNLEDNQNNNLEEEYFEINLDTFLFNAGVIGFIEVLEKSEANKGTSLDNKKDYYFENQTLYVNKKFLLNLDFAKYYLKTVYNKFYKNTILYKMLNTNKTDLESIKKYDNFLKRTTLITIADTLEDDKIKELLSNYQDNKEINFKEIVSYINDNEKLKYYLYIGNIFFDKFSLIFYNIYFLRYNPSINGYYIQKNTDFIKLINDYFIKIKEYIIQLNNKNNYKDKCLICNLHTPKQLDTDKKLDMAFLIDIGIAKERKGSVYWNFNSDVLICPICYLIYSCTPIGFININNIMVFINDNDSIESLISMNAPIKIEEENNTNYIAYNTMINRALELKTKELDSIQVIIRDDTKYSFNTIAKDTLKIIKNSDTYLSKISKSYFKYRKDESLNIYKECIENILNNRNQYNLILTLLKNIDNKQEGNNNKIFYSINTIFNILKIQIAKETLKENNMSEKINYAYVACKSGYDIRKEIIKKNSNSDTDDKKNNEEADNKLRGLVYKLINAVNTSNVDLFSTNIARLYTGLNLPIPNILGRIFISDEDFKNIGNAYIFGLKGAFYDKTENQENNNEGEE